MQNSISYWQHFLLEDIEEVSYKKSGLKNPDKADRNKDHDVSTWEKKVGSAIEKNLEEDDTNDKIDRSELNMLKKMYQRTPTDKIKAMIDKLEAKLGINENVGELKLGIKYDLNGESGFISTGGSEDTNDWKFLGDKGKYKYLDIKDKLIPSEKQSEKYDGAFDLGLGKGHHIDETEDHEVSMAQNSLKSIISAASQLMNSLGQDEKDIPAWIQDHITNAENYINQASKNYHEYGEEQGDDQDYSDEQKPDEESLIGIMEKVLGLDKDGYTQNAQAPGPFRGASREMQMSGNLESKKRK